MPTQLEAFFTHGEAPCGEIPASQQLREASTPGGPWDELLYLHAATADAGLTSLLLRYGFTRAKQNHNVVLLLCGDSSQKPPIVQLQPCPTCGVPAKTGMDSEIWQRIRIKYLKSSAELQHFACSLHLMREKNSVVLVDAFERFFVDEIGSLGPVYQTLALLYEARRFMEQSTGYGEVVMTGHSHAFMLQTNHDRLHRWCRFLQITRDGDEFILHEELDVDAHEDDGDGEEDDDEGEAHGGVAIRYEFFPHGSAEAREGLFRLVEVMYRDQ